MADAIHIKTINEFAQACLNVKMSASVMRRFAEVQEANGRKIVCGFKDAKSAFLFGVLSACHIRVSLLQTTDNRHFWRMIKILEKVK